MNVVHRPALFLATLEPIAMSVAQETIDRLAPTRRPTGHPTGYQRWHELLFLHWRVSPAEIAARIPESLSVDTFDGSAWVGIVAFRMSGVRPWWSPSVPGVSSFPETNVRTYVHFRGQEPGVWFFSLDARSSFGARLGRLKWNLPYYCSEMKVRRRGASIQYVSSRLWPGREGVGGRITADVGDHFGGWDSRVEIGRAVPGSLEHFLVERYVLYCQSKSSVFMGRVHHSPYPLREASPVQCDQSWLKDLDFQIDRPPDHLLFSEGVSTEIFPLTPVDGTR
jgi:uncharacterized protein